MGDLETQTRLAFERFIARKEKGLLGNCGIKQAMESEVGTLFYRDGSVGLQWMGRLCYGFDHSPEGMRQYSKFINLAAGLDEHGVPFEPNKPTENRILEKGAVGSFQYFIIRIFDDNKEFYSI